MNQSPFEVRSKRLIFAEGLEEKALLCQMQLEGMITDVDICQVGDFLSNGGVDGLGRALVALSAVVGFENLNEIKLVFDVDEDLPQALKKICDQIRFANGQSDTFEKYSMPSECTTVFRQFPISVSLYISPNCAEVGCLETLLLRVLRARFHQQVECAEQLYICSANEWPPQKRDKAVLRAAMAMIYRKNPAVSLSMLWRNDPAIIPVDHAALVDFVSFCNSW